MKAILALCLGALAACASPGVAADRHPAAAPPPESELDRRVAATAQKGGAKVSAIQIGVSRQGRPLHLLRLSAAPAAGGTSGGSGAGVGADRRPALLIVAGLNPEHSTSMDVALGVAEKLATEHAELLDACTVFFAPCMNPDAVAFLGTGPKRDFTRTLTPDDADRDGRIDEDGPIDLNGDGRITMMRVLNPSPGSGLEPTEMLDPDDSRLMKKPDRAKGERANYAVLIEGRDQDGDGRIAEDGPGGVDLNLNFPWHWPEFADGAGPTQLCEPESLALAQFVLDHPNIIAVLAFGPHDNLVNPPVAGRMDATGQVPDGVENDDKPYFDRIGQSFKDITGITASPNPDAAGSFFGWTYGHLGIFSFSTPVWVRPDIVKPDEPKKDEKVDEKKDDKKDQPPDNAAGAPAAAVGAPAGVPAQPTVDLAAARKWREKKDASDDAKWLGYSDERRALGHEPGFVDWTPFEHPDLGHVEIGGFIPGFRLNAPPDEIPALIDKQTKFIVDLLGKFPKPVVQPPVAERLGPGVWRITLRIVNDGYLPTRSALGVKARRMPPLRLVIDMPAPSVIAGERMVRVPTLPGSGGSRTALWVVAADDGSSVNIDIKSLEFGDQRLSVPLQAPPPTAPAPTAPPQPPPQPKQEGNK